MITLIMIAIRIVPEWNVKLIFERLNFKEYKIRIVPEWNVKLMD